MTNILPEIYDHEVLAIEQVLQVLSERSSIPRDYDAFDKEIKDRFHKIGFEVSVQWWHTNVEGVKQPEITVTGRTDKQFQFDPDRQVHEVTNNVLELPGQQGVIKTNGADTLRQMHEHQKKHRH